MPDSKPFTQLLQFHILQPGSKVSCYFEITSERVRLIRFYINVTFAKIIDSQCTLESPPRGGSSKRPMVYHLQYKKNTDVNPVN